MGNKNITFCGCKPSQNNIGFHGNFTGVYEKSVEVLDQLEDTISKGRKVNRLCHKIFDQHWVKFKN